MEINPALLIILVIVALVAGAMLRGILVRGGAQAEDQRMKELFEKLEAQNRELAGRVTQMADEGRKSQSHLTKVVEERLDKVGIRMGKSLEENASKTAKSVGEIGERLKVIDEAQKNIMALSGDIMGLQQILENKQARGAFGEVQLKDIVSNVLPPDAYSFQTTLSNGKRVDCLLLLPNPPGSICVDAKFPLDSYQQMQSASNDIEKAAAAKRFRADVGKHVKDISEKYIIDGETAESALMFLPSESVYAELHANFRDVIEASFKARVWIVSPTTMMATLNTIRAVLKDVKMREQAGLIQKEVGMLLQDTARLDDRVDKLATHFRLAEKDIVNIRASTTKITKRSDRIADVQLEDSDVEEVVSQAVPPRLLGDND